MQGSDRVLVRLTGGARRHLCEPENQNNDENDDENANQSDVH